MICAVVATASKTSGWEIATAIGTIGAALAAAAAALVTRRSTKAAEALVEVETERREEERRQATLAHVRAALREERPGASGARSWLQVWNDGPGSAVNLTLTMEPDVPGLLDPTEMPSVLYAGQRTDLTLTRLFGQPSPLIAITWSDGAGSRHLEVPKTYLFSEPT